MDPKWRNAIVVGIVVVVVVAGLGLYLTRPQSSSKSCGVALKSTNPILIDQAEIPDSLDPAVTFSTPGWAAVQQVYQGLVNYNGSSYTTFSGVLAHNWTVSPSGYSWTFHLRPGVHFSNGDPFNAYVMWYSLYRSLLLVQGPQFILEQNFFSTNFSASNPLTYYSDVNYSNAANATLLNDLNTWNFDTPTSAEIALMGTANQSFQVLNNLTIELNLGYGYLGTSYNYLLASISAPNSYAVDPVWVDQHGGISFGQPNSYMSVNTLGTGQYVLENYNGLAGGGYTLAPNPNYWGTTAAASDPTNPMIQPALNSVEIIFQDQQAVTINNLKSGAVAEASFAYVGPSTVSQLQGNPCVTVQALPTVYGSTSGSWWIYLDQNQFPFTNLSVREAIAHAINYTQIIQQAFGGYASQWVGPVPPSYPYYNPQGLSPYAYNLPLARQEIANSPCANGACKSLDFKYAYINTGTDWSDTAQFLAADLAQINLTITPVAISLDQLYQEQTIDPTTGVCTTLESTNGGPFYMGQEFYTSDYISPDDWTQNDAISYGSANLCMSQFANATVDNLTLAAAASSNATFLNSSYSTMTNIMYNNYTDIWLVVPTSFAVYSTYLHGFLENPMASAEPFSLLFNTQSVT